MISTPNVSTTEHAVKRLNLDYDEGPVRQTARLDFYPAGRRFWSIQMPSLPLTTTTYSVEADHLSTPRLITDATQAPRWS